MANGKENTRLDFDDEQATDGPVECLGMTFPSDEARREHFLEILREKLQDPEFRSIEGFPIGEDEDILALSDPPYYTACPNPFIEDFIEHYGTPYDPETDDYHREPFAADVSEGKNDAIYRAHSYHTKVPPKAIEHYIDHYTDPGDVILDGFCGAGMTGVATQALDAGRCAILVDLSPAATFISALYNTNVRPRYLNHYADEVLQEIGEQTASMFQTVDPDTLELCDIDSVVWSSVVVCPSCSQGVPFWDLDEAAGGLRCPECGAIASSAEFSYLTESYMDPVLNKVRSRNRIVAVEITYATANAGRKTKTPDSDDIERLRDTDDLTKTSWFPKEPMLGVGAEWGDTYRAGYHHGYEHVHDFYFPRALVGLSLLRAEAMDAPRRLRTHLVGLLTSVAFSATRMYRYRTSGGGGPAGNLYVPSLIREQDPLSKLRRKLRDLVSAEKKKTDWQRSSCVSTSSAADLTGLADKSVDYIFVDPPFGSNIMYSESSFLWEAWLRVKTARSQEAIMNETQGKGMVEYQALMTDCFTELFRVLKPGHWMTVEFHNSQNSVWRAIQEALGRAGFVVADVRTLDKKQGTFKQVTTAGAVKQDLIMSAYRPSEKLEEHFELQAGDEDGVWDFVRDHLARLPVFVPVDGRSEVVAERQDYLLFDRMVAFHVQRGVTVPLSAAEFYAGLEERYIPRHGMYFLPEQAAEYDNKTMGVDKVEQLELFVTDESSAIQWLRQQLRDKPQTYQDIAPQFMQQIQAWDAHEEELELSDILRENFLRYDGDGEVPSQIHAYLSSNYHDLRKLEKDDPALVEKAKDRWYVPDPNKEADLEKIRHRALMREFEEYRESKGKLKTVRTEALRAGFKECWQNGDYQTIVDVAERLPDEVVQEDSALLMYYDNALMRTEG